MNAARVLREARRRAGLTQRGLAEKTGVAQPAIARIESGRVVPSVDTLDRLLEACGEGLYVEQRLGIGVDRTLIEYARETFEPARRGSVGEGWARAAYERQQSAGVAPRRVLERPPPTYRASVLEPLIRHGVRFVIIGGVAANLHGSPVVTEDMDVCYARDQENLGRLAAALKDLRVTLRGAPAGLPDVIDERFLQNGDHFTFNTTAGPLDCLGTPAGTEGFEQLDRNARDGEIDGLPVRFVSVSDLIRMKRAAGRVKDRIWLENLGPLQEVIDEEERRRRTKDPPE